MQQSQREILHSQANVADGDKQVSGKLIIRQQITGSPYWVIGDEDNGFFLTFGKWQLTEKLPTIHAVLDELEKNKYDIILKMVLCVTDPKNEINRLK